MFEPHTRLGKLNTCVSGAVRAGESSNRSFWALTPGGCERKWTFVTWTRSSFSILDDRTQVCPPTHEYRFCWMPLPEKTATLPPQPSQVKSESCQAYRPNTVCRGLICTSPRVKTMLLYSGIGKVPSSAE